MDGKEKRRMLTGIILAGSDSKRINDGKRSLLMLGEEVLIQRQVRIMRSICSEVIIVTNNPRDFLKKVDESVRIITEYIPNKGPLSGMHAGLMLSRNQNAWIVSCDMPFLSPEAAQLMLKQKLEGIEAIIPWVNNFVHPLHGIYDRNCARHIETLLMKEETDLPKLLKVLIWQEAVESQYQAAGIECGFTKTIKTINECELALPFPCGTADVSV
jgi:molybdopterin-guanine dinucleotide biosynthesis protein A